MALWYVDNTAAGTNAGTSWTNAWTDFNSVVWGGAGVNPGDTLYISGGSTSQTYSAHTLTIGASGTAGNLITIDSGANSPSPSGHNGTVIIDGATSMTFGAGGAIVDNSSHTYLVIQNLTLQNTLESCLRVSGVTTGTVLLNKITCHTGSGIITAATNAVTTVGGGSPTVLHFAAVPGGVAANAAVKDQTTPAVIPSPTYVNSVTSTTVTMGNAVVGAGVASGDTIQFAFNARGIRVDANTGGTITVQNCTIDDPSLTIAQTDSIYTELNTGAVIIQNNNLTVNNTDPSGHSDTYQSGHGDTNMVFRANLLRHPNGGANNHGIIVDAMPSGGTLWAYNNIIIMGSTPGNSAANPEIAIFREQQTSGATGAFKCWNNTIYGGLYGVQTFYPSTSPIGDEFKNNIIYSPPQGIVPYFLNGATAAAYAASAFDYNLVFAPNSTNLQVFSTVSTNGLVRSTTSQSSGLLYAEIQLGFIYTGGDSLFGIVNSTEVTSNWVGQSTNSLGYWWSTGGVYTNAGTLSTIFTSAQGDVVAIAIDEGNHKIWFKNLNANTGWNNAAIGSQNPVGNVGGILISGVTGAHFLAQSFNSAGSYSILNVGASSFVGTVPTGYSAWGSAATWDSGHISTNLSLVQPIGNVNGTLDTYAQWQTAGYDAHGKNSDPLFATSPPVLVNDFRLRAGSPAIDAGLTIATVAVDYAGGARPWGSAYDIGAWEFSFLPYDPWPQWAPLLAQ
jgi:hypothetical protein